MTSHLGCVLIDFKLIPEMIFRKMGCLVVTSNSVKLKSISSWPNLRAKTTENHFRFHFHFKWFLVLENRRERERERERGRKKEEIATSSAPRRPLTLPAPHRSRSRLRLFGFDDFFSRFRLCFEEWMILYIRLVTEKMWVTSRKYVFYDIFKNTIKHQKIFFETFFEMQQNTWKHFPFRKIAFLENRIFFGNTFTRTKRSLTSLFLF